MKRYFTTDDVRQGIDYVRQLRQKAVEFNQPGAEQPEVLEAHCIGCKDKRQFQVEGTETMKNGAHRKYGKCTGAGCGRTISTFVKGTQGAAA